LWQVSLFLTSLPASATEESVRTTVLTSLPSVQPTQLRSVVHVAKSKLVLLMQPVLCRRLTRFTYYRCAFVNFKDRATAEIASQAWASGLNVDGENVNVKWGRSRSGAPAAVSAGSSAIVAATK
jgi:pre-mRNA-splicing factor RBM22/SLT11